MSATCGCRMLRVGLKLTVTVCWLCLYSMERIYRQRWESKVHLLPVFVLNACVVCLLFILCRAYTSSDESPRVIFYPCLCWLYMLPACCIKYCTGRTLAVMRAPCAIFYLCLYWLHVLSTSRLFSLERTLATTRSRVILYLCLYWLHVVVVYLLIILTVYGVYVQ